MPWTPDTIFRWHIHHLSSTKLSVATLSALIQTHQYSIGPAKGQILNLIGNPMRWYILLKNQLTLYGEQMEISQTCGSGCLFNFGRWTKSFEKWQIVYRLGHGGYRCSCPKLRVATGTCRCVRHIVAEVRRNRAEQRADNRSSKGKHTQNIQRIRWTYLFWLFFLFTNCRRTKILNE